MRRHRDLILNYLIDKKQLSSGVVESLNRKVNLVTRKSYGFRSFENLKIALFHTMGDLPEPDPDHEFFWRGINTYSKSFVVGLFNKDFIWVMAILLSCFNRFFAEKA